MMDGEGVEASRLRCLLRSWGHSHEEDDGGVEVYRPVGFRFPPARGRQWLELHEDGSVSFGAPGRDDRSRVSRGAWQALSEDLLEFGDHAGGDARRLRIVECADDILKVRAE